MSRIRRTSVAYACEVNEIWYGIQSAGVDGELYLEIVGRAKTRVMAYEYHIDKGADTVYLLIKENPERIRLGLLT